jgi:hypothetical protein
MDDLARRLAGRVQLTSDGHGAYLQAVEGAFGVDIDYAILIKLYGAAPESAKGRYIPAECIGARMERIEGDPDFVATHTNFCAARGLISRLNSKESNSCPRGVGGGQSLGVPRSRTAVAATRRFFSRIRIFGASLGGGCNRKVADFRQLSSISLGSGTHYFPGPHGGRSELRPARSRTGCIVEFVCS